ncbi:hypothetical protein [uncultured Desulfovibrio sp.]|uniref:hypothetical protein n=1 Tax=uncultured Desulfovibrio sp. TaxID=167968 RepID=UPI0026247244|nr:hypothetical protein [uncultured Desulfovibrio sp.]
MQENLPLYQLTGQAREQAYPFDIIGSFKFYPMISSSCALHAITLYQLRTRIQKFDIPVE